MRHIIEEKELLNMKNWNYSEVVASGDTSDGSRKRIIAEVNFISKKVEFYLKIKVNNKEETTTGKFHFLTEAVKNYNAW